MQIVVLPRRAAKLFPAALLLYQMKDAAHVGAVQIPAVDRNGAIVRFPAI